MRELSPKQRERLNELAPEYFHRVELLYVDLRRTGQNPDYVVLRVLGDDDGRVAIWRYLEHARHFKIVKSMQSEHVLAKASKELYEYATLFALQIIFAQRNAIEEARQRARDKKAVKERLAKEARAHIAPTLPGLELHTQHRRKQRL